MKTAVMLIALSGCYAAVRPGVSAPIGHGHGGAGFDLGLAIGGEHVDNTLRIGGGLATGGRPANENGNVPVGVDLHIAVRLTPYVPTRIFNWMGVAHASFGYAEGISQFGNPRAPDSPNGVFANAFVGVGLGSPMEHPSYRVQRGHLAVGLVASRFQPDSGSGFWLLGAALDLSIGWLLR